jgi:hypothetical protein
MIWPFRRRRRRDAMDIWLESSSATREPGTREWRPEPGRAPDLEPEDVPGGKRIGMTGRPLPKSKGAITGLEGGGGTPPGHHTGA